MAFEQSQLRMCRADGFGGSALRVRTAARHVTKIGRTIAVAVVTVSFAIIHLLSLVTLLLLFWCPISGLLMLIPHITSTVLVMTAAQKPTEEPEVRRS